ncbi:MAG: AAA family ATPase [Bacteroidetes bacterium]|nr:MAG: AAA family ATPase [Bacteroidota bacterium]
MADTQHFQNLLELLRQEREQDFQLFLELVREHPLAERVEQGYTWYPLQVVQTGFAIGDKAFVVVERTTHLDEPHQLRSGQTVSLFTQSDQEEHQEKQGIINYVERNRMKIILNSREVPDWLSDGQMGVDMLFDDRSYREMERALEKVMSAKGSRLAELRRLLSPAPDAGTSSLHPSESRPDPERILLQPPTATDQANGLNPSQQAAVQAILENRDVTIIHGPPGTGKTTTLVAAIERLARTENTVLVTAPSNTAADLLTERLADRGLQVVRIGNISRVDDSVVRHTVDAMLAHHPEAKNIKKVKIEAAEYRRQARKYKRTFNATARREREHLKKQARELEAWANTLEARLLDEVLSSAQAITCTLVGAAHPLLDNLKFRTCIIDEAAQALEPACWIPIAKCSRLVLAGDPFQLPPTVKNPEAAREGLATTLIERCLTLLPDHVSLLHVQYRMHQAIMDFSNQYFYGGALEAHASVADRTLATGIHPVHPDRLFSTEEERPVLFIDTAGCGFEERLQESKGRLHQALSRYNTEEALLVREHLLQLLHWLSGEQEVNPANEGNSPHEITLPTIGILSPYREQVNQLENIFREDPVFAPLMAARRNKATADLEYPAPVLSINTIDGFQGQERDVIYISLVRSNPRHEIGFLQDYRRMNVAMTRARMLLVVIGDSATIGQNKFYQAFLDYCAEHGSYKTAWEYVR